VVVGVMVVLALAAPVVASVMEPEVTTARDPEPPAASVDRATDDAASARPTRMTPAASPDRTLRQQRAEELAREEAELAREEARQEAREAAKREAARRARLRELAEERAAKREAARERRAQSAPISFRIGTFNVLGSQHTAPGGGRQKYPPASTRTAGAAGLIGSHGVDILGTQELQADQLRDLQNRTGMAAWPGLGWGEAETDNSILYDPGVFEVVSGSSFTIPFMGRPRPQPIVRFRHEATGREFYVVNTHPSAGDGSYVAERRQGQAALVDVVNDLESQEVPVLVTGDMNDREEFYCRVVPAAGLVASNGGSYGSGCQPPPEPLPVDWVVGSGATWSKYWRDTTSVNRRISDHYFISALASIG
jgi:endonuclease/exonuclease/phosphatase family metal-dependent hydrolase